MIYVCGDFHGRFSDVNIFLNKHPEITMILQCGDFGYWPKFHNSIEYDSFGNKKRFDQYCLKNKNTIIYFCDGNHEDHDSLDQLKNNEIMPNVFYMKRGSILELPNKKNILFIGGALSIDKKQRTIGHDWFPQETISQKNIFELPDEKIDIVISHTAPKYFYLDDYHNYESDPSREALNYVYDKYKPSLWYFGHMHKY